MYLPLAHYRQQRTLTALHPYEVINLQSPDDK